MEKRKLNEFGFPTKNYSLKEDTQSLENVRVETFSRKKNGGAKPSFKFFDGTKKLFLIVNLLKDREEKFLKQVLHVRRAS